MNFNIQHKFDSSSCVKACKTVSMQMFISVLFGVIVTRPAISDVTDDAIPKSRK